jgi:hypothetical protein
MPLVYRELKGYKYIVHEMYQTFLPEVIAHSVDVPWARLDKGSLTIYSGYAWDGASGPTLDTKTTIEASLVHDFFYQCFRSGLLDADLKPVADQILYRMMKSTPGVSLWRDLRAWYFYRGVSLFGWMSTKPKDIEPQNKIFSV